VAVKAVLLPCLIRALLASLTFVWAERQPAVAAEVAGARPNIILILTDDQGYGDLSCHGNPVLKTPNLDRLHDEGRRFTDFQVSPTCAPTRSALLTGRHEFKNGVTHTIHERERLTLNATTLAEVLRAAGYRTAIFGKWHLGDEPERWPDKRGFDEMFIHGAGGIGQSYPGSCGDVPGNRYFDPVILHNGHFEKTAGYCSDVFFGQAMKWLEAQRGTGKPFFIYLTPNAPHAPLDVPPEYAARYAGKASPMVAKFYGMIANLDDNVGRLLAKLAELKLDRDTLVVFMNDNGTATGEGVFNAGMRGKKGSPWVGGTRATSFWRWPGTLPPGEVTALAAHVDVLPTLAEIAGAKLTPKAASQVEGRSLVPLLKNPEAPWPERTLVTHVGRWERGKAAESKHLHASIRNSRWQFVCDTKDGQKHWQLFDLRNDPGERTDVAGQHPEVVKELEVAYDAWWDAILPCLENENLTGPAVNPFRALFWEQFGTNATAATATPR
jgi:arylsulfatase A-like enzyme